MRGVCTHHVMMGCVGGRLQSWRRGLVVPTCTGTRHAMMGVRVSSSFRHGLCCSHLMRRFGAMKHYARFPVGWRAAALPLCLRVFPLATTAVTKVHLFFECILGIRCELSRGCEGSSYLFSWHIFICHETVTYGSGNCLHSLFFLFFSYYQETLLGLLNRCSCSVLLVVLEYAIL